MPWKLDKPVSVGDLDLNPYQEVRIIQFFNDSVRQVLSVDLEYGNTVDGNWVAGIAPRSKPTTVMISGQTYRDMIETATPLEGEKVYAAVKRTMYEYLRISGAIGPGHLD